LYNPEYIGIGNNLIINMENFKAFGTITQLITDKIQDAPKTKLAKSNSNKIGKMGEIPLCKKAKSYQTYTLIKEETFSPNPEQ
jgi:hypothetical protein